MRLYCVKINMLIEQYFLWTYTSLQGKITSFKTCNTMLLCFVMLFKAEVKILIWSKPV